MTDQLPYFASSGQYLTSGRDSGIGTRTLTANTIYFAPIVVPYMRTFSEIAIEVYTAVASSHARLGLFNLDTTDGGPGTVAADAGEVSTAATGLVSATGSDLPKSITAGFYFLALWASAAITVRAWQSNANSQLGATLSGTDVFTPNALTQSLTYSAIPFTDQTGITQTVPTSPPGIPILIGMR